MSRGRTTQVVLNILSPATLAVAVALGASLVSPLAFGPVTWLLFGLVLLLAIASIAAHRCRTCGHDVTKDAEGARPHRHWPKVNDSCARCGADIP